MQPGNSEISTVKYEGRMIYYYVADEGGNVNDAVEGPSFYFKGQSLEELADKLEEETGLENIIVCTKNKFNGNIYPLRLALPPNNTTMHVVVVPSTSKCKSILAFWFVFNLSSYLIIPPISFYSSRINSKSSANLQSSYFSYISTCGGLVEFRS